MEIQVLFLLIESCFILITKSSDVIVSYRLYEITEVSYGKQIGSHAARSILDCFIACSKLETCSSVMYSLTLQQCTLNQQSVAVNCLTSLSSNLPTPSVVKYGIKNTSCVTSLGYSCDTTTDCLDTDSVCENEVCQCNLGLNFDPDTCSCTPECTHYGTTFRDFENFYMVNSDRVRVQNVELSDCLQLCIEETSFVCRLAEYFSDSRECQIQQAYFIDLGAVFDGNCVTYVRNCDLV